MSDVWADGKSGNANPKTVNGIEKSFICIIILKLTANAEITQMPVSNVTIQS